MAPVEPYPLNLFRFRVDFFVSTEGAASRGEQQRLCSGSFSECSGIEATMEPKSIKAGGRNYGPVQRAGRVSFATVVLKRGVISGPHLWKWFELVATGAYAYRFDVEVHLLPAGGDPDKDTGIMTWKLRRALPTKFKAAEFNAKGTEVGVEELQFVHEGLSLELSRGGGS